MYDQQGNFRFSTYDEVVAANAADLVRAAARLAAQEAARASVVNGDALDAAWACQDALEGHRTVTPSAPSGGCW